mmetsp:Transcript_5329/g.7142  ORF Transcript_5329/g.7142 Transcript_5329/m.7142 type:complete len:216 (-) Transcript_5329:670-1317(-)
METIFNEEVNIKEQIREIVKQMMLDYKRRATINTIRSVEMANRSVCNEVPKEQYMPDDEEKSEQHRRHSMYQIEKRLARERTLQTIEQYEIAKLEAENKNEPREPSEVEQQLQDMIFPNELAFPVHKHFRLWFSTIPVPGFPKEFARRCKLVSRELPSAIRLNTQKMLTTIMDDRLDAVDNHREDFKKLLFSLTVMHSVINKRERFGSFGWTQPY